MFSVFSDAAPRELKISYAFKIYGKFIKSFYLKQNMQIFFNGCKPPIKSIVLLLEIYIYIYIYICVYMCVCVCVFFFFFKKKNNIRLY